MIKLMVEDYCQECPDFDVNVDKLETVNLLGECTCDHIIHCLHAEKCRTIKRHTEKGLEGES